MKQIQRLVNLLKPLGLYSLNPDSMIYKELVVYGCELDFLYDKLQEIKGLLFLNHASQKELSYIEQQLCLPIQNKMPIQTRKKILCAYLSTNCNAFTLQKITQSIQCCGMQVKITQDTKQHKIQVQILSNPYHISHETALRIIKRFLPVHMQLEILNDGMSWTALEQKNITWEIWDNLDFTWNEFDVTGIPIFIK